MLADEVTHVKMGSDWLRRLTATDPERQKAALDFQRTVDKLFSFGGFRGEEDENPIHLARKFRVARRLLRRGDHRPGRRGRRGLPGGAGRPGGPEPPRRAEPLLGLLLLDLHDGWAWFVVIGNGLAGVWALAAHWFPRCARGRCGGSPPSSRSRSSSRSALGVALVNEEKIDPPQFHMFYGFVAFIAVALIYATGPR